MPNDTATTACTNCGGVGGNCKTCDGRGHWPSDEELAPGTLAEITGAPKKRKDLKALVGEIVRITEVIYGEGQDIIAFTVEVVTGTARANSAPVALAPAHLEPRLDDALEIESHCFWPAKRLKQLTLAQALGKRSERSVGRVSRDGRDFRLKLRRTPNTETVTVLLQAPKDKPFKIGKPFTDDLRLGRLVRVLIERHISKPAFVSIDHELL